MHIFFVVFIYPLSQSLVFIISKYNREIPMNSLRNSFKSHGSNRVSSSWNSTEDDQRPILYGNHHEESDVHKEVIVKIDGGDRQINMQTGVPVAGGNGSKIMRESIYEFWKEGRLDNVGGSSRLGGGEESSGFSFKGQNLLEIAEDPPSRMISAFLQKQKTSGSEMTLDMDLEMEELKESAANIGQSKELRVSFQDVSTDPPSPAESEEDDSDTYEEGPELRRGSATAPSGRDADAEVLQCTSNSSFRQRSSTLLRAKTRSRLMDPAPVTGGGLDERKSMRMPNKSNQYVPMSGRFPQWSGQLPPRPGPPRSGLLGKPSVMEEDEEDPFEDLPDEFKRTKISTCTILQLISLILVIAALVCSLTFTKIQHRTFLGLQLWKWVVLVLVLLSGRLLSGWFIRIIVFFIERSFKLRKRLLYFVYGVRHAVQNCIWLGLVLLAWQLLFDKKAEGENKMLSYITRILFCLIVATVLRLVKTLLLKVLASSFHVNTYFDRIQEAIFNQYVIEALSGPPLIEIQHNMEEEDLMLVEVKKFQNAGATIPNDLKAAALPTKSKRVIVGSSSISIGSTGLKRSSKIGKSIKLSSSPSRKDFSRQQNQEEDGITMDQLQKLNQKNISAWKMKKLMRIIRNGTLTTLDEQIPQGTKEDESAFQIRSEHEAKIAARKIFSNVARLGAKHIYLVDLMRFMRDDEAVRAMRLFNGTQDDNRVSRRALKNWVINAFRERRALSLTLNDTKTAVNKLHQMANMLLLVFIFGNTLKMVFEDIIFLFVIHPFDVGDRCEVDGVQMVVEEMNILSTVFLRYDHQKITYPNGELAKLPIGNFYRSPDMGDSIDFCIHVSTPVEKIAVMRERITVFVESKKEHWYPGSQVVIKDFEDINRLKVSLWMRHRINFQDMGQKWTRRDPVIQELIRILRELDIEYRMLPVDVNLRNLPPVTSNRLPSTWTTCS